MYCEKMDISVWTFHYCDVLFWVRLVRKERNKEKIEDCLH